ncbi:N-acetylglucosamine kinase [Bacteroidota bacterium]
MSYLIGFDGGGTKTKCVVTNDNLEVQYECTGGPSNFLMLGNQKVTDTIISLLNESITKLNITYDDVDGIVLGSTGAGRRSDAENLEKDFNSLAENKGIKLKNFRVESDARIALEGAFSGKPGCILIAGTGSIMFGKDKDGNIHRVGGFGRFIGDEGSGYMLGKKGLNAVAKQFDGRGDKTNLSKILKTNYSINDPSTLITEIYKNNFNISSIAPHIIKCAETGDEICLSIIEEEVEELILHLYSMQKKLNVGNLNVCLIGSIISTNNFFSKTLKDKVSSKLKNISVLEPELPPALGAALMAKKLTST